ncbi:MAG: sialate O-acetylesterase [Verrucomicrobiota bacterium]|nr:sialate O-acetylesterase [Verrucomicrobiota bacterium]
MKSLALFLALALAHTTAPVRADVRLPAHFSDHLVLQAEAGTPVWGWAEPGKEVAVAVAGQTQTARADARGKWMVRLPELKRGGPHTLTVKGRNTLTVNDMLVGEVWLGSGQSNMAMTVNRARDFEQEQAAANFPQIRMFTVASAAAAIAQEECKGEWVVCSPETVTRFSATAYFFGREIHQALGTPVGLINSSVGGTPIESWISLEAQQAAPELQTALDAAPRAEASFDAEAAKLNYEKALARWKEAVRQARAENQPVPRKPRDPLEVRARKGSAGGLFNGKIAPLIPYAIRGALWYQGEANSTATNARLYRIQLPLLVKDWRTRWGQDFPFAWVQLPNFDGPGRDWPTVREAMLKTLALPRTGMAITIDIGDAKDIHPKNKQEVGRRLALWALGAVYGRKGATSGPLPRGHEIRESEVVLSFAHTDGGLAVSPGESGEVQGFVVAGEDKQWKPARARIDGEKVVVSSTDVKKPVAVRYGWENNPVCNLRNGAGLPASPFRTDDWE